MAQQDLYELLDVRRDATEQEIRSSYRRRALQVHPDKGGSEDLFHSVMTAFEVLSSRSMRLTYDAARGRGLPPQDALAVATGRGRNKAASKVPASHRPLAQLRKLLASLTREARHEALQALPEEVRQALVAFMQQEPEAPPAPAANPASSNPALADATGDTGGGRISRGILRNNASPPRYQASIFFTNLLVMSMPHPSLELVLQRHSALLRTRDLLSSTSQELSSSSFHGAFAQACQEADMAASEELESLVFCAIVPAYYEVNRQIRGRQTKNLASALAVRDRLLEAKAEGWPALRHEWMVIMQSPAEVGHRAYSAEEAERIADSAWDACTASRARAEAKRSAAPKRREQEVTIEKAAKAVARALKAEAAEAGPRPKKRKT